MSVSPSRRIYILLILLCNIHLSFSTLYEYTRKIEKKDRTEKIALCLKIAAENLFLSTKNLYLIADKHNTNLDVFRNLYNNFSFITESNATFENKSVKRYIIIKDNLQDLEKRFQKPMLSEWSQYLILIKTSFEKLSKFAKFLYKLEFFHVAFLLIDEQGNVSINQFDTRPSNNTPNILITKAHCDDSFLTNKNVQKMVRRFNKVICPPSGCTLSYWNLITDAPKNLIYTEDKINGKSVRKNPGTRILEAFADRYNIRITTEVNNSNIDMSWKEAVKSILNGTVDAMFGFTLPDAEDVEPIAIGISFRFSRLEMLYVPRIKRYVTGNLFSPLNSEVWLCFMIVLLLYGIFIYAVKRIHEKNLIREYLNARDLIRIFTRQDFLAPTNGGLRVVVGMMLIFALLLTNFYESAITSSFIARVPQDNFNTLNDLKKSGRRVGGPKFIRQFFNDPGDPLMVYLYDRFEIADSQKLTHMMQHESVVMLHNSVFIQDVRWGNPRNFTYHKSNRPFVQYPNLFYLKKGHLYTSALKHFTLRLFSSGVNLRLDKKISNAQKRQNQKEKFNPLTKNQLTFIWTFLLAGWIISLATFFGEFLAHRFISPYL